MLHGGRIAGLLSYKDMKKTGRLFQQRKKQDGTMKFKNMLYL